jgi:hypothetical protein
MLHRKIWTNSFPGFLSMEDSSLDALSAAYCRDTLDLGKYGITGGLASLPRRYLKGAITCLQQLDADHECNRLALHHYEEEEEDDQEEESIDTKPALTPVEKLMCIRDTLDRISRAAEKYMVDMSFVKKAHEGTESDQE